MSARPDAAVTASLPDDPHRAVGRLIKLVLASLVRGIDQRMQPLGLTAMQWEPLLLLSLQRVDTVAALARESQVNCGAMTRMLDRLADKQLVERRRSDTDRRVVHLELTGKGRDLAGELLPIISEELHRHLRDFSPEETRILTELLQRMLTNGTRDLA